ncbi:hypothetical protein TCAL_15171 [Tigriopus californicus]|uniref:Uncharacterized protein n=1 Tax=Tigriopus californicus TaxID=6832 RepID=A0A553NFJ4_TIGCA|nr:hypothetical protein TCAL_15171 [Tigriopus californicus]
MEYKRENNYSQSIKLVNNSFSSWCIVFASLEFSRLPESRSNEALTLTGPMKRYLKDQERVRKKQADYGKIIDRDEDVIQKIAGLPKKAMSMRRCLTQPRSQ